MTDGFISTIAAGSANNATSTAAATVENRAHNRGIAGWRLSKQFRHYLLRVVKGHFYQGVPALLTTQATTEPANNTDTLQ